MVLCDLGAEVIKPDQPPTRCCPHDRARSLDGELYFYSRIFGFDLADPVEPVEIANL
jgi:hypothetical protein